MMTTLGIDPGILGGWAVLNDGVLRYWGRIPTTPLRSKTIVDCATWFENVPTVSEAVVELVGAFPGQGRTSCYQFGHSVGSANAIATLKADDVTYVTPQVWKKHHGIDKDKRAALALAAELWPDVVDWSVLRNDGIAEAALMAQWRLDTKSKIV